MGDLNQLFGVMIENMLRQQTLDKELQARYKLNMDLVKAQQESQLASQRQAQAAREMSELVTGMSVLPQAPEIAAEIKKSGGVVTEMGPPSAESERLRLERENLQNEFQDLVASEGDVRDRYEDILRLKMRLAQVQKPTYVLEEQDGEKFMTVHTPDGVVKTKWGEEAENALLALAEKRIKREAILKEEISDQFTSEYVKKAVGLEDDDARQMTAVLKSFQQLLGTVASPNTAHLYAPDVAKTIAEELPDGKPKKLILELANRMQKTTEKVTAERSTADDRLAYDRSTYGFLSQLSQRVAPYMSGKGKLDTAEIIAKINEEAAKLKHETNTPDYVAGRAVMMLHQALSLQWPQVPQVGGAPVPIPGEIK